MGNPFTYFKRKKISEEAKLKISEDKRKLDVCEDIATKLYLVIYDAAEKNDTYNVMNNGEVNEDKKPINVALIEQGDADNLGDITKKYFSIIAVGPDKTHITGGDPIFQINIAPRDGTSPRISEFTGPYGPAKDRSGMNLHAYKNMVSTLIKNFSVYRA